GRRAACVQVVLRHARRVARIAHGLLTFARESSGEWGRVDLNQVVEDTLLLLEKELARADIAVRRSLLPRLPPIHGQVDALQQVVMNLVTTAPDPLARAGELP